MLNIIVAPAISTKGAIKSAKIIAKYLKTQNVEYSVYFSHDFEEVKSNINQLTDFGESDFVLVGDDLIVKTFVNTIKDLTKVKFGIVPTGNCNDFATYLGLSKNPTEAISGILNKNIENVDFMLVNDKRVINSVIIGASVETEEKFNQYKMKNFVTHTFADIKYASKFEGVELTLSGRSMKTQNEKFYELIIANGGLNKGQQISPLSNLKDGNFNAIFLTQTTEKENGAFFKNYRNGKHIYDDETKQLWLNNIKITSKNKQIKCMIDGDICTEEQLDITLVEGGLNIYTK